MGEFSYFKEMETWSQSRIDLIVLGLVWVKIIMQGEFRILFCNPSGGSLVFMVKILEQVLSRE